MVEVRIWGYKPGKRDDVVLEMMEGVRRGLRVLVSGALGLNPKKVVVRFATESPEQPEGAPVFVEMLVEYHDSPELLCLLRHKIEQFMEKGPHGRESYCRYIVCHM